MLHSPIVCDGDGYPLKITNSSFEILGVSDNGALKGNKLFNEFVDVWNKSEPLTENTYNSIYL